MFTSNMYDYKGWPLLLECIATCSIVACTPGILTEIPISTFIVNSQKTRKRQSMSSSTVLGSIFCLGLRGSPAFSTRPGRLKIPYLSARRPPWQENGGDLARSLGKAGVNNDIELLPHALTKMIVYPKEVIGIWLWFEPNTPCCVCSIFETLLDWNSQKH